MKLSFYCRWTLLHGVAAPSGVARHFVWGGSTKAIEDREQREQGFGDGSPLVRGSAQFANE
jgi:hypothetical protein